MSPRFTEHSFDEPPDIFLESFAEHSPTFGGFSRRYIHSLNLPQWNLFQPFVRTVGDQHIFFLVGQDDAAFFLPSTAFVTTRQCNPTGRQPLWFVGWRKNRLDSDQQHFGDCWSVTVADQSATNRNKKFCQELTAGDQQDFGLLVADRSQPLCDPQLQYPQDMQLYPLPLIPLLWPVQQRAQSLFSRDFDAYPIQQFTQPVACIFFIPIFPRYASSLWRKTHPKLQLNNETRQ